MKLKVNQKNCSVKCYVVLIIVLRVPNIILVNFVAIFASMLTGVSADSDNVYCYDSEKGGTFCFESRHGCEIEQKNDLMADSWCSVQGQSS